MLLDEGGDASLAARVYQRTVFFVRNQGFVELDSRAPDQLHAETLPFEQITRRRTVVQGLDLVDVPAAPLPERVAVVARTGNSEGDARRNR